jgi:predicted dehydrogenase
VTTHRLAVVGCGDMEDAHQQVFADLGDRVTVIGTADVVLERAQHAAKALGAPRAVTDYTELLDEADACLIVTPHDLHHEMGMTCLRAGKHVLMEKPMAVTEQQCLELIETARTTGRQLMTAYPMRFHPLVARLRELVAGEALGEVFQVSIFTEQHTEHPEGHWIRSAARLGGGQLFSHGCHYVDLLLWMLGEPVRGTHTGTRRGTPWMEWEGTSNAVLEFASGALGYHFGTWGARATRHGYAIHAHCAGGRLAVGWVPAAASAREAPRLVVPFSRPQSESKREQSQERPQHRVMLAARLELRCDRSPTCPSDRPQCVRVRATLPRRPPSSAPPARSPSASPSDAHAVSPRKP